MWYQGYGDLWQRVRVEMGAEADLDLLEKRNQSTGCSHIPEQKNYEAINYDKMCGSSAST